MSTFRKSPLLLLLALAILAVPGVSAQAVPTVLVPGPAIQIDTPRPGVQVVGQPLTAHAPGITTTLVAWMRGGPDGRAHVIWARQIESPNVFGPERVLVRAPGKIITEFALSAGWYHYAVAWLVFDPARRVHELYARVFDLYLNPIGPPIWVSSLPTSDRASMSAPRVGIDDSGRLVVARLVRSLLPDGSDVMVARFGLNGELESLAGTSSPWLAGGLALAVAPNGSHMLAWDEENGVRATLYGPDGAERQLVLAPGEGSDICSHAAHSPALAAGYTSFFAAFVDTEGRGSSGGFDRRCRGVFAQVYDHSGGILREELRVKRDSWSPIVQHNRSQYLVTWYGEPPAPNGVRQRGTYAHPYRADGHSVGPELFVQEKPVTGVAFEPAKALLVWADNGVKARYLVPESR